MTIVRLRTPVGMTGVMCMAEVFSMTGFACYTTLLPGLMKEWTLSNAEAGLIGGIFYSGYMVAVPVLSLSAMLCRWRRGLVLNWFRSSAKRWGNGSKA